MLKLSKLTDYGIVLLAQMAKQPRSTLFSARALSESTGVPFPTVEKLMKQMLRADLLRSKRGARGGYMLARSPESVSLAHIIDTMQGSIALTECTDSTNSICDVVECCGIRDHWPIINGAVRAALSAVSLRDLAANVEAPLSTFSAAHSDAGPTPEA